LGHKSSKTTEIYTHVSNRELGKIKNPLDMILNPDVKDKWGSGKRRYRRRKCQI